MNRRTFLQVAGGATGGAALAERLVEAQRAAQPQQAATPRRALMKVGTQHGDTDAVLRSMAGFGVTHICSELPSAKLDATWSVEGLSRLKERVESFGLTLDMVPLPLSSSEISRSESPA